MKILLKIRFFQVEGVKGSRREAGWERGRKIQVGIVEVSKDRTFPGLVAGCVMQMRTLGRG